jgi:hypothetical protein
LAVLGRTADRTPSSSSIKEAHMRAQLLFGTVLILATALLTVTVAGQAPAQPPPVDAAKVLAGRWEGQRQAEDHVSTFAFVFRADNKRFSGDTYFNGEFADGMTDVVVKGNKVTFVSGGVDLSAVMVDTKSMTVTATFQGRDLWTLTMTKKDKS